MQNDKVFGALRATTMAALCAGGMMFALGGCSAESGGEAPADGDKPAVETSCGEKKAGDEKSCGEGSCGKKAGDEKAGDEKSCGGDKK